MTTECDSCHRLTAVITYETCDLCASCSSRLDDDEQDVESSGSNRTPPIGGLDASGSWASLLRPYFSAGSSDAANARSWRVCSYMEVSL